MVSPRECSAMLVYAAVVVSILFTFGVFTIDSGGGGKGHSSHRSLSLSVPTAGVPFVPLDTRSAAAMSVPDTHSAAAKSVPVGTAPVIYAPTNSAPVASTDTNSNKAPELWAAMGINLNPVYMWYVPLTCAVWNAWGAKCLVTLIGSEDLWNDSPPGRLVVRALKAVEAKLVFMHLDPLAPPPFSDPLSYQAYLAQTGRVFASSLPGLKLSDWIITSDSDLWPLTNHLVRNARPDSKHELLLFNSRCCGTQSPAAVKLKSSHPVRHLPLCHIAMSVKNWRKTMFRASEPISFEHQQSCGSVDDGYPPSCSSNLTHIVLKHTLQYAPEATLRSKGKPGPFWSFDQDMTSVLVQERSDIFPKKTVEMPRGERYEPNAAWDVQSAGRWVTKLKSTSRYADAHLSRQTSSWPGMRVLLSSFDLHEHDQTLDILTKFMQDYRALSL